MSLGNILYCEFAEDGGDDYDDDNHDDDDEDKDEDNDDEMIPVEAPRVAPWLGK